MDLPTSYYCDIPAFMRLTTNHEIEIKRNHLNILYFLIKKSVFENFKKFLDVNKQDYILV
jgi:hypothetical protein